MILAEIPYPRIDPVAFRIPFLNNFAVRWYGISYIVAFALATIVLRGLSKLGRWPIHPDRVLDVLFWGILGVMFGGRIGDMLLYPHDRSLSEWFNVRKGGMSFHGGLAGVIIAYVIYCWRTKLRFRDLADGLALATPLGIACVRLANFVNAELPGNPWNGPWAMRFPIYRIDADWDGTWDSQLRHPSQLYQMLGEGLCVFVILRLLMLGLGWGGGRIAAMFLVLYGVFRFLAEYFRAPDTELGYEFLGMTRGQELCAVMIVVGLAALALMWRSAPMTPIDWNAPQPDPAPPIGDSGTMGT
jgi:phosphatidylglycerol:prolipoprotein diacylglycerol transferase